MSSRQELKSRRNSAYHGSSATRLKKNVARQQDEEQMVVKRAQEVEMSRPLLQSALPDSDELDTQLFADFYETYLPANVYPWREITYLRVMAETVPATTLLKQAKRTMGLVHVGALGHNERILQESRIAYGRLLGMLNLALRSGKCDDGGNNVRGVLSAMALMTHVSDRVRQLAKDGQADDSWVVHLEAAQHLLMLQGPRHLNAGKTLDKGLIRHIVFNSFFLAVAKRKVWTVNPGWLQIETKGWSELLKVFGGLPSLLEKTDRALSSEGPVTELLKHVSRLDLMASHALGCFPGLEEPPTLGLSQAQRLRPKTEELTVMAGSTVFLDLYAPMSEVDANRFALTTMLSLLVQCTILRIWSLCPDTTMLIPDELRWNIELNADRLARRLCKVVLSFTQTDRIVSALILRLFLTLAYNVFEQQNSAAEMGWCHACLVANRSRLDRIRQNHPHTLCKVGAVLPGIAEAGRYGAPFDLQAFTVRDDRDAGRDVTRHGRYPAAGAHSATQKPQGAGRGF